MIAKSTYVPVVPLRSTVATLCILVATRIGLSTVGYRRLAARMPRTWRPEPTPAYARQVARRVRRLAAFVPGASCLTQALAAKYMLARSGHPTRILIGVRKGDEAVEAHAWLVAGNAVILGGGLRDYSLLTELS